MKLTVTQQHTIESALDNEDFIVTPPAKVKGGALLKSLAGMKSRGLIEEVETTEGDYYVATIEALEAIDADDSHKVAHGIRYPEVIGLTATIEEPEPASEEEDAGEVGCVDDSDTNDQLVAKPPRAGTKIEMVIAMLTRTGGATMQEIMNATEWLPHTARSQISTGATKYGYTVTSERHGPKENTIYKIGASA